MNPNESIKDFINQLGQSEVKDQFLSILQFGKSVRINNYAENLYNILFVVNSTDLKTLIGLQNCINDYSESIHIEPFILTKEEMEAAADVYPIKFLDISQNHIMLSGIDPFNSINISKENLRLRSEQELRNISLRLRNAFVVQRDGFKSVRIEVRKSLYPLMNNLEVLLTLKANTVINDFDDILEQAYNELNIDLSIVTKLLDWSNNEIKILDKDFESYFDNYRIIVDQLVELIDKLK